MLKSCKVISPALILSCHCPITFSVPSRRRMQDPPACFKYFALMIPFGFFSVVFPVLSCIEIGSFHPNPVLQKFVLLFPAAPFLHSSQFCHVPVSSRGFFLSPLSQHYSSSLQSKYRTHCNICSPSPTPRLDSNLSVLSTFSDLSFTPSLLA